MDKVDLAIYNGTLTADLLRQYTAEPLPPAGQGYWADHIRDGLSPRAAALRAAQDMASVLRSLR